MVRPLRTDFGCERTTLRRRSAFSSARLTSSDRSRLPLAMRVSENPPTSLRPSSQMFRWPRRTASSTGTGLPSFSVRFSYVPLSQTIIGPAPYSPLGNHALEIRVLERMIFGAHGEALVGRIERGPLGHGP